MVTMGFMSLIYPSILIRNVLLLGKGIPTSSLAAKQLFVLKCLMA